MFVERCVHENKNVKYEAQFIKQKPIQERQKHLFNEFVILVLYLVLVFRVINKERRVFELKTNLIFLEYIYSVLRNLLLINV